jgi:hypothetical protein
MIALIKLKNIGKGIMKLHLKYSLNINLMLKENNILKRKMLLLKFKLNLELIMLENNLN